MRGEPKVHSHGFDCNGPKLMWFWESSVIMVLALLYAVSSRASFHCWPIQVYPSKNINTRAITNQTPTTTKREDCYTIRAWPTSYQNRCLAGILKRSLQSALVRGQHCICRTSLANPYCPSSHFCGKNEEYIH